MKQTTFGQVKIRQPFYTISDHRSEVYPNGVRQDFIKRTSRDAWDENKRDLFGFTSDRIVFIP